MLRGIAFCAGCGAPMYRSYAYLGGQRGYVCSNKLQSTGACTRPAIPAELLEGRVLNHLATFVGSVDEWIAEVLGQRNAEAVKRQANIDARKAALAALDRQREDRMAELSELGITAIGMEIIERLDSQREAVRTEIAEAEAVATEWSGPPDVDAALDFYNGLVDAIQGRIKQAPGVQELNEALASVLAGLWCELDPDRDYERLLVQFALHAPRDVTLEDGTPAVFRQEREWLPPAMADDYTPVMPLGSDPDVPPLPPGMSAREWLLRRPHAESVPPNTGECQRSGRITKKNANGTSSHTARP
jgi:hypothetical protein